MNEVLSSADQVSLKMVYNEIIKVRRKLESFEDMLIPTEEVSKDELQEIEELKTESLKGEHVRWDELKKRLSN
jgi:hypothetical protein